MITSCRAATTRGREYLARNPTRADDRPGSFSVNLDSGRWADFATDDRGGDLVSLVAYLARVDQGEAARRLAGFLGLDSGSNRPKSRNSSSGTNHRNGARRPSNGANSGNTTSGGKSEKCADEAAIPFPGGAPTLVHPKHGPPALTWPYSDADGRILFMVCRWDFGTNGARRKTFAPAVWTRRGVRWQAWPAPRPLYNLPDLLTRADAPILIAEGEKATRAAAALMPAAVCTTTSNGAASPAKTDWTPVKGRRVLVWPDADAPGARYAEEVARLARAAGAAAVEVLDLAATFGELPAGWDAADAIADAWTAARFAAAARWRAAESAPDSGDALRPHFEVTSEGVLYHGVGSDRNTGAPVRLPPLWIASPLHITAATRDERSEEWGRLLEFRDPDHIPHVWAMPSSMLKGSGEELRGELLRLGLDISTDQKARRLLGDYIQESKPAARALCVPRTGWHGGVFVLPDRSIGEGRERVLLQKETLQAGAFGQRGTVGDWQARVASLARGNSRVVFAIACAFAAPLLALLGDESGGFHLRGASSTGKTTALRAAASVWGGPAYVQRWRATDNGLEALAEIHSDALLVLDELAQVEPRTAGACAYMLSNGTAKARADRTGAARALRRWRLLFLSAGEVGLAEHMAEAARRVRAGQEVRLADIPADAGRGLGMFEEVHGHASGAALADAITGAAAETFGAVGLAFLERLVADRAALPERLGKLRGEFVGEALAELAAEGQAQRMARRFGLVAIAGELATAYGLTGWPPGEVERAARACFAAWVAGRGGAGDAERGALVAQVAHFLELHGESRFSPWDRADDDHAPRTSQRAGFVRYDNGARIYYVTQEVFRRELAAGFDHRDAARWLAEAGMLRRGDAEHWARKERLPGFARPAWVYVLVTHGEGE